jgi:hypothetical protein
MIVYFHLATTKQIKIFPVSTGGSCSYSLSFWPHRRNSTPTFWPARHKSSGYQRACYGRQSPGTNSLSILLVPWAVKQLWIVFSSYIEALFALSLWSNIPSLLLSFLLTGIYQQAWCTDGKETKWCLLGVYDFAWGTICKPTALTRWCQGIDISF